MPRFFGLTECNPVSTPLPSGTDFASKAHKTPPFLDVRSFQQLSGSHYMFTTQEGLKLHISRPIRLEICCSWQKRCEERQIFFAILWKFWRISAWDAEKGWKCHHPLLGLKLGAGETRLKVNWSIFSCSVGAREHERARIKQSWLTDMLKANKSLCQKLYRGAPAQEAWKTSWYTKFCIRYFHRGL